MSSTLMKPSVWSSVKIGMWMDQTTQKLKVLGTYGPVAVAVAIPACNEAALIIRCLKALDFASGAVPECQVTILVLVNNCTDQTANYARAFLPAHATIHVEEVRLNKNDAHAGGARRRAMDHAAEIAGLNGVIMTSDADSEVSRDWIAANLSELNYGADAVAGTIAFRPAERLRLMQMLRAREKEWQLANLQARLITLIDPTDHDPWPMHIWEWGASLAVTVEAYLAVGGLPSIPLAEDRAFGELLTRHDFRVRHSHAPVVFTSGRLEGRASCGFADMINHYCMSPNTPCDAAIEPTADLVRRLHARRSLREQHGTEIGFGDRWYKFQSDSSQLRRARVSPCRLAFEIADAKAEIMELDPNAIYQVYNCDGEPGRQPYKDLKIVQTSQQIGRLSSDNLG